MLVIVLETADLRLAVAVDRHNRRVDSSNTQASAKGTVRQRVNLRRASLGFDLGCKRCIERRSFGRGGCAQLTTLRVDYHPQGRQVGWYRRHRPGLDDG